MEFGVGEEGDGHVDGDLHVVAVSVHGCPSHLVNQISDRPYRHVPILVLHQNTDLYPRVTK